MMYVRHIPVHLCEKSTDPTQRMCVFKTSYVLFVVFYQYSDTLSYKRENVSGNKTLESFYHDLTSL